jgi:probable HAF family extracellular repeat protein
MTCYTLTDLGTLGGRESYAFDLKENNEVVGYAQNAAGADRAFLFADANNNGVADPGEMRDLGVLAGDAASYAYGLNNAGEVVGTSRSAPLGLDGNERAVRFNSGAAPTDLGLGHGVDVSGSNAVDINEGGTIVGGAISGADYLAFARSAAGVATSFALPPPYNEYAEAQAVNFFGAVVGYSGGVTGDSGFLRATDGTLTPVGHPNPAEPYNYAWDISDAGYVAGEGYNSAGDYHAFRYNPDSTVTDLGTLPGFESTEGFGVSNSGTVVGRADPSETAPGPSHAFIYRDGVMRDLNGLLAGSGAGWVVTEARAINSVGAIVGVGVAPNGSTRAVLLRPAPPVRVTGEHVFYNNSAFDGHDPAANPADDAAIALDKEPLRVPGRPAYDGNVTSYTKGINGIMVDLSDPGTTIRAVDFAFKVGTTDNPADWPDAPAANRAPSRRLEDGTDRFTLTWPDGAVRNTWLQVTVRITDCSGEQTREVFYYGNLVGNVARGNFSPDGGPLVVNALDLYETRRSLYRYGAAGTATVTHPADHNRDGRVNALDIAAVRENYFASLRLISPPATAALAEFGPAGRHDDGDAASALLS